MRNLSYIIVICSFILGCNEQHKSEVESNPIAHQVVFDGITDSISPGDDFFNHVNKIWFENTPIADDQVGVGAYRFLNIPQQQLLQNILNDVSAGSHQEGSIEQQVGDFYASGMDTLKINERGKAPLMPILQQIEAIDNTATMLNFVAKQITSGDYSIFAPRISPDQENSSINILHFSQAGLGLPDRDYYFSEGTSVKEIQEAYKQYLSNVFELIGEENTLKKANTVYAIESALAKSHKTRIERRIVKENYNKFSIQDLHTTQPNIDWHTLLDKMGADVDSIDIRQPVYYKTLNSMLNTTPLEDWKLYLKAHSIRSHDAILSSSFQEAAFEYEKILSGQSEQQDRAKLMTRKVDRQLGFALGQLYVKRYFNEDAKDRALALVTNFQKTLEQRISNLDWMSDSTKVKAIDKLYAINKKIGYPDVWRTYNVEIDRDKFFENVVALRKDEYQYELSQLNQPPNRNEWHTTPSTVTAYYNPSLNEIVFPAGILQAPYFDLYADDAVNYGGIGMVIGHEFTHAFDDQGAQYDKNGNVSNWWTETDYKMFEAKTKQIINQYSQFTVLDSVYLKGALTVGENTADNGGIAIAYDAFKMTDQGKDSTKIGGYTPDQRFFLSIARIWRVKMREEFLRNYVTTDSHSPPIWRVNGPLMNFTPFYDAFQVTEGQKNYKPKEERIKIW
ncbi:M13 family metallopeptidase [Cochleicola gelatinilyticus]|uniref:Peptidase M13 n=1 Tax=Cochleicola gelatinilyticus TaxID=1763537 RepID=A0A167GXJ6_9FLAO|nr:M13 family metallopeptidase [Cochleicola gelatinilyticus]OAB78010.1 peptidase M13 [Cochleicola gelatinilyticus]